MRGNTAPSRLRRKSRARTKAAVEFQVILDHRGISATTELHPLAQLNLARAYAMQGDVVKARTAYQDFFHSGRMLIRGFRCSWKRRRNTRS